MATPTIDTLGYARELKNAGFTDSQAESMATALDTALSSEIALKGSLTLVETKINGQLTLLKWMVGVNIGFTIAVLVGMLLQ